MSPKQTRTDLALLWQLILVGRPQWMYLLGLLGCELLLVPLALLVPIPVKIAVDCVLGDQPLPVWLSAIAPAGWHSSKSSLLFLSVGLILAMALLQQLRRLSASVLKVLAAEGLNIALRSKLLRHVQQLSLRFHDRQTTGDTLYRIQEDSTAAEGALVNGVIPIIGSSMTVLVMLIVMLRLDWQLTTIALGVCPILLALTYSFRPFFQAQWTAVKVAESTALEVVQEILSMIRVVITFGQERREHDRFVRKANEVIRVKLRVMLLYGAFGLAAGMTVAAGTATVLYLGVRHVQNEELTMGNLLLVLIYLAMMYQPITQLSENAAAIQSSLAGAARVYSLLDEPSDVQQPQCPHSCQSVRGDIEFRHVTFSYHETTILQDVTLSIPAGSRVGISGKTGVGKSTLMSLLPRLYDPGAGQILLDGIDLRQYDLRSLRAQFSIVLQDTSLISTTIGENIAYGRPDASMEEIVEAAQLANAHDFISALPDQYATHVGERGSRLSGGERQRIALARAFLRNAPILILDEPTSAVDVGTEAVVLEAIHRLMVNRTTFIISHRPGTLDECDPNLILDQGRVAVRSSSGVS